jgi:15-cis-phytoene synthase
MRSAVPVMSRDTNFYYSFLVLPREKRQAIIAVWDFCRAVDDAVDKQDERQHATASAALEGWRRELLACYGGGGLQTPQGRELRPFIERFHLPRQAFEDVIDGVAMDLHVRRYQTFDELYQYCLRVASAVGLICLEIFGYRDIRARDYAIDLGIALQLTNIIRDIRADLERGRLYLPLEDLARFGCSEEDLRAGVVTPRVAALLRDQCERARLYYAKTRAFLPREEARRLVAAEIMGAVYFAILTRIERAGYDVFSQTIRIPRAQQAAIAAATWTWTMLGLPALGGWGILAQRR